MRALVQSCACGLAGLLQSSPAFVPGVERACGLAGLQPWIRCLARPKHARLVGKQAQLLAYLRGCCVA